MLAINSMAGCAVCGGVGGGVVLVVVEDVLNFVDDSRHDEGLMSLI